GPQVESYPPTQPGGAGAEAGVPAPAGVELANQVEEPRGGGLEVRRQLGDLVAQPVELRGGLQGDGEVWRVDLHGESPSVLRRLYTRVSEPPGSSHAGRP